LIDLNYNWAKDPVKPFIPKEFEGKNIGQK
jgi:hypothetical protein